MMKFSTEVSTELLSSKIGLHVHLQRPMLSSFQGFLLILENKKKSVGSRSGLYGGCGSFATPIFASYLETISMVWLEVWTRCKIQQSHGLLII
ncbi:hypothetical protein TNCT_667381 [Trichonephila clavata]|uniref:Uncharacterized protein n=1 Tax=Trichonephila clavata TaxID=2740835 RepID=A0A8X6HE86_TRICU|nr:hypothetical protein TNCT_667381 [Trichonephila clavata]